MKKSEFLLAFHRTVDPLFTILIFCWMHCRAVGLQHGVSVRTLLFWRVWLMKLGGWSYLRISCLFHQFPLLSFSGQPELFLTHVVNQDITECLMCVLCPISYISLRLPGIRSQCRFLCGPLSFPSLPNISVNNRVLLARYITSIDSMSVVNLRLSTPCSPKKTALPRPRNLQCSFPGLHPRLLHCLSVPSHIGCASSILAPPPLVRCLVVGPSSRHPLSCR